MNVLDKSCSKQLNTKGCLLMWFTRFVSLLLLVCSSFVIAEDDISGASDDSLIERFRGSVIVNYQPPLLIDYSLALGSVEKVNGVERLEREERLTGYLKRISYRVPDGNTTRTVFNDFKEQLDKLNAEMLFTCQGRGCGSSNYWANDVFGFSQLYGVERSQYYMAARLPGVTVVIYVTERGNRRVYAHIDLIETDAAARMVAAIKGNGFVEVSTNALPDMDLLEKMVEQLKKHTPDIALVVHHKGETLTAANDSGLSTAEALRQLLATRQISGVEVYSVGALVPSVLNQNQLTIVLVSGAALL